MGRCLKCNHYDICDNDRINSEEVWGGCRYFEDDSIPTIAKSEYNALKEQLAKAEAETARKIFDEMDEILDNNFTLNLASDYPMPHFYEELNDDYNALKKKYKVEE